MDWIRLKGLLLEGEVAFSPNLRHEGSAFGTENASCSFVVMAKNVYSSYDRLSLGLWVHVDFDVQER